MKTLLMTAVVLAATATVQAQETILACENGECRDSQRQQARSQRIPEIRFNPGIAMPATEAEVAKAHARAQQVRQQQQAQLAGNNNRVIEAQNNDILKKLDRLAEAVGSQERRLERVEPRPTPAASEAVKPTPQPANLVAAADKTTAILATVQRLEKRLDGIEEAMKRTSSGEIRVKLSPVANVAKR